MTFSKRPDSGMEGISVTSGLGRSRTGYKGAAPRGVWGDRDVLHTDCSSGYVS